MSNKKAAPIPAPPAVWYFRDRAGHRYGPYTDPVEIRAILTHHVVGKVFLPANEGIGGTLRRATEFVMEDAEYRPLCPQNWLDEQNAKRYQARAARYRSRYGAYTYRQGPVAGIHKSAWRYGRNLRYGRLVRDTGAVCPEDGEPPIRKCLQVTDFDWDEFFTKPMRSWKRHRRHRWKD